MKGFVAFPSEQGLPYDVLLDVGDRLFRVQVKTTTGPRVVPQRVSESTAYIFNVKRAGKNNTKRHENNDLDIFALVCLDTRKVGYLLNGDMPDTLNIRVDALRGTHYDEKGIKDHATVMALSHLTGTEISKQTGIPRDMIYRMRKPSYKPHETGARYFSDFERGPDWFAAL